MRSAFLSFLAYNLLFFGLQLLFILSKASSFISAVPLPLIVYLELFFTLLAHLGLYFSLSLLQTGLFWGINHWVDPLKKDYWHLGIWSLTTTLILAANTYYFPLSDFSKLLSPPLPIFFIRFLFWLSLTMVGLLLSIALIKAVKHFPRVMSGLLIVIFIPLLYFNKEPSIPPTQQHSNPNVIIIGVDSLSPSRINPTLTPNIYNFLQQSTHFTETISPLARTFPAWSTILTGLYPFHHHVEENLVAKDNINIGSSFAIGLKKIGYQTIYATDDRRFNNMEEEFGFEKYIGPKLGVNDIILGTFNDFPLSNLIMNLPISAWLFPYNYINRESHFSYYPQIFDKELRRELQTIERSSPVLFAVHFALPHWPYAWAASSPAEVKNEYSVTERNNLYEAAVQKADEQVGKLLQVLHTLGYLDHSFIILLSDHGEALYLPGSRRTEILTYQGKGKSRLAEYLEQNTSTVLNMSAGHGSDLLSPDQFHCFFGIQIRNDKKFLNQPKEIRERVGLIDIAPTLNAFFHLDKQTYDGISLLSVLTENKALPERPFFLESGMMPNQFLNREKARELGRTLFYITKEGKLEQRRDKLEELYKQKLYGVIEGNWLLAMYPVDHAYLPIILRISDNQWIDNLDSPFALESPAQSMLNKLSTFFQRNWPLLPIQK